MKTPNITIPKEIQLIADALQKAGFEAYAVGGCVRDNLRGIKPKDWDIATNAEPEQIEKICQSARLKTIYENSFGTVAVHTKSKNPTLKVIEITPYRIDDKYSDKRHPDSIKWAKTIKQDLARRDFTVNAIGLPLSGQKEKSKQASQIIDPFDGQKDLSNKIIRAVGAPDKRFSEDALRMMRAVRFSVALEPDAIWAIEQKTGQTIKKNKALLNQISKERIRDELIKIIMSPNSAKGIELLRRLGLLEYIIPELEIGFGVSQNKHHMFQVYQHNLLALNYASKNNFSQYVRLAALLHDIGKPQTKRGAGANATFHSHEFVGAKITEKVLTRLRFSKKDTDKITKLVRFHLFYYNVDEVGETSVRRLLRKVGQEDIEELLQLRYADRIGSGVPKAEPYKLRHLKYLFEKVAKDPISVKMLKINGDEIMAILNVRPSPMIGHTLTYLLSQVLSDPKNNTREYLKKQVEKIGKMSAQEIVDLAKKALEEINEVKMKQDKMTKQKYWVT